MKKGHKGKRRHPASLRSNRVVARHSRGFGRDCGFAALNRARPPGWRLSPWSGFSLGLGPPPGSAPASLRSLWCPAAASGRCVTAEFRWGSSRVSHRLRRRRRAPQRAQRGGADPGGITNRYAARAHTPRVLFPFHPQLTNEL